MRKKTALITGAAGGIGLAIARDLAAQGCTVMLSDANAAAVKSAVDTLQREGLNAIAQVLDVTSEADIAATVSKLEELGGHADILINNAGVQYVSRLEDFPVDRWKLLIDILLVGPAMLTRGLMPLMRRHDFGRIVNIGSIHSLVASPHKSAYVSAKHGLLGFSKAIALETASQDITINTVCPSYVKTALVDMQIANQAKEHGISEQDVINNIMLEPMPKKNFIDMDELTGAVNYLISDAARNMTGHELVLDGGWTAR